MDTISTRLPLYLLLLILPLAVAGQNIGTGVVALLLFAQLYTRRGHLPRSELWATFKVPLLASLAYLAVLVVSTAANPDNPARWNFSAVGGHLIWCLLPPVLVLAQPALSRQDWRRLLAVLAVSAALLGAFALSQAVWGWHLVGSHFESGPTRAQGLYSHPLTFAYVCLLLFPIGCMAVCRWPRQVAGWVIALAMAVGIAASRSRTVEGVAAVVVLVNVATLTRGRLRWALLGGIGAAGVLILVTANPIGEKFRGMLERHDVRSDYPVDDRLAFWHANFAMVLERPLLGHGENLGEAYRTRFYDAIGLAGFERKYPAHNMYLQLAVNGGLVGLAAAMTWFLWHWRYAWRMRQEAFGGRIAVQTLAAFGAGGLTQNAFQDSGVRYALCVFIGALWLARRPTPADATAPDSTDSLDPGVGQAGRPRKSGGADRPA